ncbi:hypothetical protein B5P41_27020 [Bacillus sp. SRB_28]|nr:hypothetical protein B5P41_27020 [Bacillus sp. SRB_28]
MYVVNDDVIYRKVRVKDTKFGTSNDEGVKITGLKQAPKDICIAKSIGNVVSKKLSPTPTSGQMHIRF